MGTKQSSSQIFYGEAILNDKIVIATVDKDDKSSTGTYVTEFTIQFKEPASNETKHSQSVTFGQYALNAPHIPSEDHELGIRLVQFYKFLPKQIADERTDPFEYPKWDRSELLYRVGNLIRTYFTERPRQQLKSEIIRNSIPIKPDEVFSSLEFYAQNQVLKRLPDQKGKLYFAENGWHSNLNRILTDLTHSMQTSQDSKGQAYMSSDAEIEAERNAESPRTELPPAEPAVGHGRCSVVMNNNRTCHRELSSGSSVHCILHDRDSEKSVDLFSAEVQTAFGAEGNIDLTRTVFPKEFRLENINWSERDIIFDNSVFHGPVHLRHIDSIGNMLFDGCRFHSELEWFHTNAQYASFKNCHFKGDVRIVGGSTARGIDFEGSRFHEGLYVNDTTDGGNMFSYIDAVFKEGFNHRSYSGKASKTNLLILRRAVFENPNSAYLYDTELLRLSLSGCDVKGINIINCGLGPSDNLGQIYDETQLREEYFDSSVRYTPKSVVESYQQLQVTMLRSKNYEAAGILYVREMDLRRRKRHLLWQKFGKEAWYRGFALYGESYWRPIRFLLAMLLILPIIQMFGMGDFDFEWTANSRDFALHGFGGWCEEFVANLKAVVYFASDPFKPGGIYDDKINPHLAWNLVIIAEKLIVAILGSFIVIALRRKFKRY